VVGWRTRLRYFFLTLQYLWYSNFFSFCAFGVWRVAVSFHFCRRGSNKDGAGGRRPTDLDTFVRAWYFLPVAQYKVCCNFGWVTSSNRNELVIAIAVRDARFICQLSHISLLWKMFQNPTSTCCPYIVSSSIWLTQ
jgi:hypothetical protein